MIGGISGYSPYFSSYSYQPQQVQQAASAQQAAPAQQAGAVIGARRASALETPVQPVNPVTTVDQKAAEPANLGLSVRQGVDPVEMAVRMRIQYLPQGEAAQQDQAAQALNENGENPGGVEGVLKTVEDGKCQTCEERKYQDGSDDMGVSYQTPTRIDPDLAPSAVRGHEMEHVVREQAKAQREDRKVVSQSVTLHTDICPECGKVYISGGTTRTTTASNPQQEQPQPDSQNQQGRVPFSAVA